MARAAVTQLQQQIEEVRREAFAAGYAAAMQAVREVASRPARQDGVSTAAPKINPSSIRGIRSCSLTVLWRCSTAT